MCADLRLVSLYTEGDGDMLSMQTPIDRLEVQRWDVLGPLIMGSNAFDEFLSAHPDEEVMPESQELIFREVMEEQGIDIEEGELSESEIFRLLSQVGTPHSFDDAALSVDEPLPEEPAKLKLTVKVGYVVRVVNGVVVAAIADDVEACCCSMDPLLLSDGLCCLNAVRKKRPQPKSHVKGRQFGGR